MDWNFGDILDGLARRLPADQTALVHGDRIVRRAEFDDASNRLARHLLGNGAAPGDKVAVYLRNCPEYLITVAALVKARLVHVNVNYRYQADELEYILENSDAMACVYAEEFSARLAELRARLPALRNWIEVAQETPVNEFAEDFLRIVTTGDARPLELARSGDDLIFIYTGGTTGLPKAVMWRQADMWQALGGGGSAIRGIGPPADLDTHLTRVSEAAGGQRLLPLSPLMHGAGLMMALNVLANGGVVVTLPGRRFDAVLALDTIGQKKITMVSLVGDAFARPLLDALDREPDRFELSSLEIIVSTGVMWSPEIKAGLLRHKPDLILWDSLGSSEGIGFGTAAASGTDGGRPGTFRLGQDCKVFTEDLREVEPGSGEPGFVARSGPIPLGYYKDADKTARTFPTVDGIRYSMPGDWCLVAEDGTLTLLGRGNICINTGGEKVYPEEVEESLKRLAAVEDALVVGLPDEKWGQAVTAVVQLAAGHELDEEQLREHVRSELAAFKIPKHIVVTDDIGRAPNGKADYAAARSYAEAVLGG